MDVVEQLIKPLNARQIRFCQAYARCLNATKAYMSVYEDSSKEAATTSAVALLAIPQIVAYVDHLQKEHAEVAGITEEWVLSRMKQLVNADPNELTQYRRVNCRFCWGHQNRYQWTPQEYKNALVVGQREAKCAGSEFHPPDCMGGMGYSPKREPNPTCPECAGDGEERAFFADTRTLSPGAKMLFAGVKTTQHGVEIKMHDQAAGMERLAKYIGMDRRTTQLVGAGGGPIQHEQTISHKRAADLSDDDLVRIIAEAQHAAEDSEGAEDGRAQE